MRRARFLLVLATVAILLVAGTTGAHAGRPSSAPASSLAADESLPGWAIPLIVAAMIAAAVTLYYLTRVRKEE